MLTEIEFFIALYLSLIIFRYETESVSKIDDLEHAKMKLQARLAEAEDTIEGLNNK